METAIATNSCKSMGVSMKQAVGKCAVGWAPWLAASLNWVDENGRVLAFWLGVLVTCLTAVSIGLDIYKKARKLWGPKDQSAPPANQDSWA